MQDDKKKVEDFVSLWRKKMLDDPNKPSAIGETLERIKEVEKENEELRNKIKENIELMTKTEEIIKKTIEENNRLKEEINQSATIKGSGINTLQEENQKLNNQVNSLLQRINEMEEKLRIKNNQIIETNTKLGEALKKVETTPESTSEPDSTTKALVDGLQLELSKKKSLIVELEQKVTDLNQVITVINEQLIDKETHSHVDYVIPIETQDSSVIKPQPAQTPSKTLEILCQDLQADLNKYKRVTDKLTQEKAELSQIIESGGFKLEPEEISELKRENEELKAELLQIHINLKEKSKATPQTLSLAEAERLVEDLQDQIQTRDQVIADLKKSKQPQIIATQGPMSNLVEDLQNQINKLKLTLEEKNKIIAEFKSS
jgi:chromosome segregation ATPase